MLASLVRSAIRARRLPAASFVWLALILGCGGGSDGGTTNPPPPPATNGYTISASSATSSVARGASSTVTVTVTRTGTFAGPVSLQPTGMPTGVSALFNPASVPNGQTQSTLTFTASASATLGTATITVIGNGSGVTPQNLTIQLTVTARTAQTGRFTSWDPVEAFPARWDSECGCVSENSTKF